MKRFAVIKDRSSGEILARGEVKACKSHNPRYTDLDYISVDGKWFFDNRSDLFEITEDYIDETDEPPSVPFTKSDDYQWLHWRVWDVEVLPPIYRDNGLDELDPEVAPLVYELNKWDSVETIVSCCGHGKDPLWVTMSVSDTAALETILTVIRSPDMFPDLVDRFRIPIESKHVQTLNYNKGVFTHICNRKQYDYHIGATFTLMTLAVGEEAYKDAKRLTRCLEEVRSMTMFTKEE